LEGRGKRKVWGHGDGTGEKKLSPAFLYLFRGREGGGRGGGFLGKERISFRKWKGERWAGSGNCWLLRKRGDATVLEKGERATLPLGSGDERACTGRFSVGKTKGGKRVLPGQRKSVQFRKRESLRTPLGKKRDFYIPQEI